MPEWNRLHQWACNLYNEKLILKQQKLKTKKAIMKKISLTIVLAACSWALFAQDTTGRTNASTMNNTTSQQMDSGMNQNNTNLNSNSNLNNNTSYNQTYNDTSTSNYSAYGIPDYVQTNVRTQYPNASNLTWTSPTADWYHGYYSDANGRYTHVYYSKDPYYNSQYYPERVTGYTVSLPVLQTYIPDPVITTASNLYKQNLYDITALKGKDSQEVYQVRVQDNGELKSMWMDANGTALTDYWRTDDEMNMNNTTNSNSATSTDTNAAMDNSSSTDHSNMNNNSSEMNNTNSDTKMKTKMKMSDGSMKKTKTKTSGSAANNNNQ